MKRSIALAVMAAAVTLFTGVAAHAYAGGKGPARESNPVMSMLQKLDLNDVQKQQVRDVFRKHDQIKPLVKQMVAERRTLRNLIQTEAIDEQAIRGQSARVAAVSADLAVERARLFHDMRGILTPAQLQKLKELQARWDQKTHDRMSSHDSMPE